MVLCGEGKGGDERRATCVLALFHRKSLNIIVDDNGTG